MWGDSRLQLGMLQPPIWKTGKTTVLWKIWRVLMQCITMYNPKFESRFLAPQKNELTIKVWQDFGGPSYDVILFGLSSKPMGQSDSLNRWCKQAGPNDWTQASRTTWFFSRYDQVWFDASFWRSLLYGRNRTYIGDIISSREVSTCFCWILQVPGNLSVEISWTKFLLGDLTYIFFSWNQLNQVSVRWPYLYFFQLKSVEPSFC